MEENNNIVVIKHSGEKAVFDVDKLRNALMRSGASSADIEHIISIILTRKFSFY